MVRQHTSSAWKMLLTPPSAEDRMPMAVWDDRHALQGSPNPRANPGCSPRPDSTLPLEALVQLRRIRGRPPSREKKKKQQTLEKKEKDGDRPASPRLQQPRPRFSSSRDGANPLGPRRSSGFSTSSLEKPLRLVCGLLVPPHAPFPPSGTTANGWPMFVSAARHHPRVFTSHPIPSRQGHEPASTDETLRRANMK